jgi:hypothetical protein
MAQIRGLPNDADQTMTHNIAIAGEQVGGHDEGPEQ